ncbi:hypothetical protein Clacol_001341 [Clathrus columnatus]|uniref:NADH dehydrogenase [ubiquinone] 1 alpha subcomplex subunit 1 n=1 Tax=Clathrus columnatus TaxID=1419009 RepID=A0AAV4ZY22_9AGAM|nr:hypothetical protein Clacol_001341 [Clathrus columnatus]
MFGATGTLTNVVRRGQNDGKPPRYGLDAWEDRMMERDRRLTGSKRGQRVGFYIRISIPSDMNNDLHTTRYFELLKMKLSRFTELIPACPSFTNNPEIDYNLPSVYQTLFVAKLSGAIGSECKINQCIEHLILIHSEAN